MIDALRRVAPKSDTAATRSEIKAGWLHQLLHRADKEIAEVGFEAVPPLLQLRRLARNLDGVPGDKDIPPPEEPVTHNGYPLRVMKVSDYGRFKGTTVVTSFLTFYVEAFPPFSLSGSHLDRRKRKN